MSIRTGAFFLLVAMTTAGCASPARAATSDPTQVMAVVRQFVNGFNRDSVAAESAVCAPAATIIDDFAPHQWQTCADWMHAYDAWARQNGVTNSTVALATPRHIDITGNVAYVVVPTTYTYKEHGRLKTMTGSLWTVILKRSAGGWRITGWAWADG